MALTVCVQDELLVVKDKMVLEIVDLVKWVAAAAAAAAADSDGRPDELLSSRPTSTVDQHGL